jgi:hypothetical protein
MKILSLFLILISLSEARAAFSPLSVALVPPLEFPSEEYTITGARLSLLYGKQRDIYGLDFGLLGNITTGNFGGMAVSGLFNYTMGTTHIIGLQFAGLVNINTNKTTVIGVQLAAANYNSAESAVEGLQFALANINEHTKIYGVEVGIYNRAQDVYGFQIGLVNVANSLHGVQIGLLNFNKTGLLSVSPLLNIGF